MKTQTMSISRRTRESKRQIMLLILILRHINVVDSVLVEFPNNTAILEGTNDIEFKCRSDKGYMLKWFIQANDTTQRQLLSDGNGIIEQAKFDCKIQNRQPGEFILTLSTKNNSAQTYTCHEPDAHQERSAELIIIIEPNRIWTEKNDSHVILNCIVKFRGNWAPELEWRHNGTSVVKGIGASVVPNQNVSSFLVIPRNDKASAGNYTCTTRFDLKGKPNQTTDTSVPSYTNQSILTIDKEDLHSETWLSQEIASITSLEGYNFEHKARTNNQKGGESCSDSNSKAQKIPKQSFILLVLEFIIYSFLY